MMAPVPISKDRNLARMSQGSNTPSPPSSSWTPLLPSASPTLRTGRASFQTPQAFVPSAIFCSQSMRSRQTRAGFSLVPRGILMLWMRLLR